MCMKLKILTKRLGVRRISIPADYKGLNAFWRRATPKKGELKLKVSPTMFMKTKENESDKWAYPTMLMKTKAVSFLGHDVYENNDSYGELEVESEESSSGPRHGDADRNLTTRASNRRLIFSLRGSTARLRTGCP
jgi:hypothetical protein